LHCLSLKILKGAEPGRLASRISDQARNGDHLKTATVLGLTIPPSVLARADEVIE
jgi:putative tryptophan/tyrosine transport system substrate-binding protein